MILIFKNPVIFPVKINLQIPILNSLKTRVVTVSKTLSKKNKLQYLYKKMQKQVAIKLRKCFMKSYIPQKLKTGH